MILGLIFGIVLTCKYNFHRMVVYTYRSVFDDGHEVERLQ